MAIDRPDIVDGKGDWRWLRFYNELHWIKTYWHSTIQVFSQIDTRILAWLNDGDMESVPPLPPKK